MVVSSMTLLIHTHWSGIARSCHTRGKRVANMANLLLLSRLRTPLPFAGPVRTFDPTKPSESAAWGWTGILNISDVEAPAAGYLQGTSLTVQVHIGAQASLSSLFGLLQH